MPGIDRPVFAGVPHHTTQRGNGREDVFFNDEDRAAYLEWLREYCLKYEVQVLAYWLMPNPIHIVDRRAGQVLRWRARGRPKVRPI